MKITDPPKFPKGFENDKARLIDLVRYQRAELHEANLITDTEYAELCQVNNSPARLETYDELRAQLAKAISALEPFSELYKGEYDNDRHRNDAFATVSVGDLRLASTTLAELKGE
jgi:DNA repair ATPase RecN